MDERPLIVGLGNEMRGDDAAGLLVADLLHARGADARRCEGEPITLLELWRGREAVLVVDAVEGSDPGRIRRFEAGSGELSAMPSRGSSTHLLGLAEVLALAGPLGRAPARLTVIGIEGRRFGLGERPSTEVERAIETVAAALLAEVGPERGPGSVVSTVPSAAERGGPRGRQALA